MLIETMRTKGGLQGLLCMSLLGPAPLREALAQAAALCVCIWDPPAP